jgi:hypothetical protein
MILKKIFFFLSKKEKKKKKKKKRNRWSHWIYRVYSSFNSSLESSARGPFHKRTYDYDQNLIMFIISNSSWFEICFNIFIKNLGRCSYARTFKQNRQFCKLLQSTKILVVVLSDIDCGLFRNWFWLADFEIGLTADVTGQQRMLTPPRHLILPSQLSGARVAPAGYTRFCICLLDYDYLTHF